MLVTPTTAPVKLISPDPVLTDGSMAAIPPAAVVGAWQELIAALPVSDRR